MAARFGLGYGRFVDTKPVRVDMAAYLSENSLEHTPKSVEVLQNQGLRLRGLVG